jgi:hypothetical protein
MNLWNCRFSIINRLNGDSRDVLGACWRQFDDHIISGHTVWTAAALEESGIYHGGGAFSGFGCGREHGDF